MQFEVIRKSHKKEVVIGVVAIILIAVVLLVRASFAKYQTIKSLKIAEGIITYTVPDFKIMGIYYQKEGQTCTLDNCYEEKESMPEFGYEINISKSYCELNGSKDENAEIYTNENGQHIISKLTKGDRCFLYFDKVTCGSACKSILENVTVKDGTPTFSSAATTDEGIFKSQDDYGDSYYFRGAVENNYIKFGKWSDDTPDVVYGHLSNAYYWLDSFSTLEECQKAGSYSSGCISIPQSSKDMYWRIIRINGDGSIRLIYDGTIPHKNGDSGQNNTDGLSDPKQMFNTLTNDNSYVGFMYGNPSSSYTESHLNANKSNILTKLEAWYKKSLINFSEYIDINAGFCGDRTSYTDKSGNFSGGGTGKITTYYGAYIRLVTNKKPSLKCPNIDNDLYTLKNASNGNRSLTYPIGLITADEVAMAGGINLNQKYYLYNKYFNWTMSPYSSFTESGWTTRIFNFSNTGGLSWYDVTNTLVIRPVINLRSDVKLTGTGTISDPYVVVD